MRLTPKGKFEEIHFSRLSSRIAARETGKFFDSPVRMKPSTEHNYSIDFIGRKFIFTVSDEFTRGQLVRNLLDRPGILGAVMAYDKASKGYFTDKIVTTHPISQNRVSINVMSLQGETRYSGIGVAADEGINFTIRGTASEGKVRSVIKGTIDPSGVSFKKSIMPNRIYKKVNQPRRSEEPRSSSPRHTVA